TESTSVWSSSTLTIWKFGWPQLARKKIVVRNKYGKSDVMLNHRTEPKLNAPRVIAQGMLGDPLGSVQANDGTAYLSLNAIGRLLGLPGQVIEDFCLTSFYSVDAVAPAGGSWLYLVKTDRAESFARAVVARMVNHTGPTTITDKVRLETIWPSIAAEFRIRRANLPQTANAKA
ncbi:MAG: hypothetical protein LR015_14740, partial [Verrucomicrobia bacterium]|nr:hypothetical protein [Verrucomicrobiota bacterium]